MQLAIALAGGLAAQSVALPDEVASKASEPTRESTHQLFDFIPQVSIFARRTLCRMVANRSRHQRIITTVGTETIYMTDLRSRPSEP